MRLRLTDHIIIIESLAAITNKERSAQERGGRGADFFNWGDGGREGGCVYEDLLVESAIGVS